MVKKKIASKTSFGKPKVMPKLKKKETRKMQLKEAPLALGKASDYTDSTEIIRAKKKPAPVPGISATTEITRAKKKPAPVPGISATTEITRAKRKPEAQDIKLKKIGTSDFFVIKKRIHEKEESEFGKFDLHTHTKFSPCAVTEPETLVRKAKQAGLKGFAITDHNTIRAWPALTKLAKQYELIFIPGQEIDVTFEGRKIGHVLALFTYDKIVVTDILDVIDEIKSQSALLSVSHPFDFGRGFKGFDKLSATGPISKYIPAVETFNSRVLKEEANIKAKDFAEKNGLFQTAGSDAHMPYEVGNGYLIAKASTELELLREIKLGRVVANGKLSGLAPRLHTLGAYMHLVQDKNFK